jgi:MFS family permease
MTIGAACRSGRSRAGHPPPQQWVINGYLLALAALFALGGKISDVVGHRRMVLVGTVGFAVASVLCGVTPKGSAVR